MTDRCFDKCVFVGKPYGVSQESYCQHCSRTGESNSDFYHEEVQMNSKTIVKPVVHYFNRPDKQNIHVGSGAMVVPLDHPSDFVSNKGHFVFTSKVLNYDTETGEFETRNTIYKPAQSEQIQQLAEEVI